MLRGGSGKQRKQMARAWNLVVFSVGGRRFAARADELAGISKWTGSISTASGKRFGASVICVDQAEYAVFDLAGVLNATVRGDSLLCLMVKHPSGALAICIDEEMPVLHTLNPADVQPCQREEFPTIGSFSNGADQVPILSISELAGDQKTHVAR